MARAPLASLPFLLAAAAAAPGALRAGEDRAADLLREAEDAARGLNFPAAAVKVAEAGAADPDPRLRKRIEALRADVDLAAGGIDALAREVNAHPERFAKTEIGRGLVLSPASADRDGLTGALQGGTSKIPWASVDRGALVSMVERASLPAADLLGAAALLQTAGEEEAAERALLGYLRGGGDAGAASTALARWRRESPPKGGYVEHGGRLLTPEDRDALVLEDRKAAAYAKLTGEDGAKRREGFEDLKALGEPAKWTLYKGLRARRSALAEQLAGIKVFSSPATKARLRGEVEKRRAEALALIEDPKRYPYPSETHKGQEEVDRLVGLVRQAWEDPFEIVAPWDPAVAETMKLVAEVDAWIAETEPDYQPDAAAVKGPANALLDVPGMFPDDYSPKVLDYNLKVRTSADREERDNVLAVNEYRIMMGRPAVKIHERLVRAARGHSRHMRTTGYFSHNNEVPGLKTPGDRAARQGYAGGVGENISMGPTSGRMAFDGWFHSSGHHRNMIAAGWTEMGAGRSKEYFTQVFGRATGKSLQEPDPLPPPAPDVAPEPE